MEEGVFGKRIRPHDRYQFEMKLDYVFGKKADRHKYLIESYFFLPPNLGLSPDNYGFEDFYKDVQNYIRFKTPVMSFEKVIDEDSEASPLTRLKKIVDRLLKDPTSEDKEDFIYESKLLACIFKSTLRDNTNLLLEEIERFHEMEESSLLLDEVKGVLTQLLEKTGQVTSRYGDYGRELFAVGIPKEIRSTHQLVDEYLSITIENYLYHLLEEVDHLKEEKYRQPLFEILRDSIAREEKYRRQKGYLSVIDPDSEKNEIFLYRHGLIKKFVSKILFLEISRTQPSQKWRHFFYSIAAGLAMLFATAIGFYAQMYFPNYSFGLLFAFVVIYMFKDRIKDVFKGIFSSYISRKFFDRRIEIFDPETDTRVGVCKEKFYYTDFDKLDKEIQEYRSLNTLPALGIEERREHIIHYKREMSLSSRKVSHLHSRISGLNDILRFNVKRMLVKLDEPYQKIPFVQEKSTEISHLSVSKIYHLNVVFRFTIIRKNGQKETKFERLRVVLNQKGIQRVEKVSRDGRARKVTP